MAKNINVPVANKPGKVISVPFSIEEPTFLLVERIAAKFNQPTRTSTARTSTSMASRSSTPQQALASYSGGKSVPGLVFTVIFAKESLHKVEFSKLVPAGHAVLLRVCIIFKCEYAVYRVICPISKQTKRIPQSPLAFTSASIAFHGIKTTGEQYMTEWMVAKQSNMYQLFDLDPQTSWNRLVIESVALRTKGSGDVCLLTLSEDEKNFPCGHRFHDLRNGHRNWTCPSRSFKQLLTMGRKTLGGG
ncbi:hypothetical protein BGZ95_006750 [Linnemannia exigua]|uniref:Uncharacterized protein n=1 Tax=Linnemannia exigua TaxID=604196 RepID=A0AAD4H865_9FUNG|nr:hypothetical protein BGZ95_006750 [Linnemannia exigua]